MTGCQTRGLHFDDGGGNQIIEEHISSFASARGKHGRGGGMYMEFTFTGDPAAMTNRIVDDTRLEVIADQEELLRTVVNSQLKEFHEK